MKQKDICLPSCVDKKAVKEAKSKMLDSKSAQRLSESFRILGDPTRVRMLFALSRKELCVCDLSAILEMTQSAVSHQLQVLRMSNLVSFRKEGKIVYYSLADNHVMQLLAMGLAHAQEG